MQQNVATNNTYAGIIDDRIAGTTEQSRYSASERQYQNNRHPPTT